MKKAFSLIELSIVILIIGILVAGVTQGSRLVSQMRLISARTQTQSSPINSISDLMIWVEATSEKSFLNQNSLADIQDGDTVRYWNDISVRNLSNKSISQTTTGNQPLYVANAINGLPAIRFNVSNTAMALAGALSDGYKTDNTTFIVFKYTAYYVSANSSLFILTDNSSELNLFIDGSGAKFAVYNGATIDAHTALPLSTSAPSILSRVYNRATNTSNFYQNAVLQSSTTAGLVPSYFTSSLVLTVGNHPSAPRPVSGDIGEIIVFDRALKTEERQAVEKYLGKKWGIKVS